MNNRKLLKEAIGTESEYFKLYHKEYRYEYREKYLTFYFAAYKRWDFPEILKN